MNDPSTHAINDSADVGLVRWQDYVCKEAFTCESGDILPEFNLRYETYGRLNAARDNAILICHALSGDHHCAGIYRLDDRKPGWWNNMIGPGKPIDTRHFFVICVNVLGSCQGSTGPTSLNPETGQQYRMQFPPVSIGDMVRTQFKLIHDHLGIEQLYAVVGGSMGGMQALQWVVQYPEYVRRFLALATTGRQSAQAIAFNEVGRLAIMQDTCWKGGEYEDEGPKVGLSVARMMAHITYLSDEGMEQKFGRSRKRSDSGFAFREAEFQVESYLRYQGQSFINRFDANSYLYLTKALDHFDLYSRDEQGRLPFEQVQAKGLVVAFTSDWLFPPSQNRMIVNALLRAGKQVSYAELPSILGHDSFLVHAPELYQLVRAFLMPD